MARCVNGSYLQASAWAVVKAPNGWTSARVTADAGDGGTIGAQLLLRRPRPLPWAFAYAPRGPVATSWSPAAVGRFTDAVRAASLGRVSHVRIDPEIEAGGRRTRLGAWPRRSATPAGSPRGRSSPRARRVIDLAVGEAALWSALKKKWRQYVNKARTAGVTVIDGGDDPIGPFYRIYRETADRAGFLIRTEQAYRDVWEAFHPSRDARMLFAIDGEGTPQAALFLVHNGSRVVEPYGGMTDAGADSRANYLLKWEAIRGARGRRDELRPVGPRDRRDRPLQDRVRRARGALHRRVRPRPLGPWAARLRRRPGGAGRGGEAASGPPAGDREAPAGTDPSDRVRSVRRIRRARLRRRRAGVSPLPTIRAATADELAGWDRRTVGAADGDVHQSLAWGEHRAVTGWRVHHLATGDGGLVLALGRPRPWLGGGRLYVPRGPVDGRAHRRLSARIAWPPSRRGRATPATTRSCRRGGPVGHRVRGVARGSGLPPGRRSSTRAGTGCRCGSRRGSRSRRSGRRSPVAPASASTWPSAAATAWSATTRSPAEADPGDGFEAPAAATPAATAAAFERFHALLAETGARRGFGIGGLGRRGWWNTALAAGYLAFLEALAPRRHAARRRDLRAPRPAPDLRALGRRHRRCGKRGRRRAADPVAGDAARRSARGREELDLAGVDVAGARYEPQPGDECTACTSSERALRGGLGGEAGAHARILRPGRHRLGGLARRRPVAARPRRRGCAMSHRPVPTEVDRLVAAAEPAEPKPLRALVGAPGRAGARPCSSAGGRPPAGEPRGVRA